MRIGEVKWRYFANAWRASVRRLSRQGMSLSGTQDQNILLHHEWKGAVSRVGEALSAFWRLER